LFFVRWCACIIVFAECRFPVLACRATDCLPSLRTHVLLTGRPAAAATAAPAEPGRLAQHEQARTHPQPQRPSLPHTPGGLDGQSARVHTRRRAHDYSAMQWRAPLAIS